MLRYLRKVQRIFREFLADMPNDLPYTLCWLAYFSLSKPSANIWPGIVYVRKHETTPSFTALWLGRKKQSFSVTIPTLSQGALLRALDFPSPEFSSYPFRRFPASTNQLPLCLATPLPEKLGGGVRPASQNPYPIYDQNLRYSLPYLWPDF